MKKDMVRFWILFWVLLIALVFVTVEALLTLNGIDVIPGWVTIGVFFVVLGSLLIYVSIMDSKEGQ